MSQYLVRRLVGPVAQSVEQAALNRKVQGSNPCRPVIPEGSYTINSFPGWNESMPKGTHRGGESSDLKNREMGRHRALLSDPKVKSWWEERSLRSRLTADHLLRVLGRTLERVNLTPEKVLVLAEKDPDHLRDLLIRDAAKLKAEGRLDSYIVKLYQGLGTYLRFNRIRFDGIPHLSPIKGASLVNERVPSPEELGRVLEHLSLRGRVIALFMAHTGVRPGVLGSYQGESGLTLADLLDLKLEKGGLSFPETPFAVRVPASLSKTRVSYLTFGSSQLASTFLEYLSERRKGGETLGPKSAVIAANPTRGIALRARKEAHYSRGFLTTKAVIEEIREALQATVPEGVRWRPYVLRAYCSTRLLMAEGAGKISRDLREAILGHDTGVSGRYNVGKTWGPELLKEARAQYKRAEPYLLTTPRAGEGNENATRVIRLLLEARGVSKEVLDKHDLGSMSDEEIVALIKTVGASSGTEKKTQKAVPVEEVPKLLEEGWEFIATLGGNVVVLKAP